MRHCLRSERAAVKQLDLSLLQRAEIRGIQLVLRDAAGLLRGAERGLSVGLLRAHQLGQSLGRPGAGIVFLRGDPVDQVVPFARGVIRTEHTVLQIRVEHQVGQQADDTSGQSGRAGGVGLVDAVGQKADDQGFALLAHDGFYARAVQLVERRAERAQVGKLRRTAPQNLRQTGAQRGIRPAEGQ